GGWGVGWGLGVGLGLGPPGRREDLTGHRRGEPGAKHHLNEPTARQATALYLANELSDRVLVHVATSSSEPPRRLRSACRCAAAHLALRCAGDGAQENRPESRSGQLAGGRAMGCATKGCTTPIAQAASSRSSCQPGRA